MNRFLPLGLLALFFTNVTVPSAWADDVPVRPWKDAAEVSLVSTNGNSRSTTTSLKNLYEYDWSKETTFQLTAQGLGSSSAGTVTAENYQAGEKATRKLTGRNYLYENFTWTKDRFAGIGNRYDSSVGAGRLIVDTPRNKLNGELGPGYVNEERTNAPRNEYVSGRAYAKYIRTLSATATFSQDAEYLHNFKDAAGYRLNTETALIASMTAHLSLKASFQWKRNALPPPGTVKDDTFTSAALIVNY